MIEHIVLLKLKKDTTKDQINDMMDGLEKLKSIIPGILQVSGGYNNSPENKNSGFDFAFIVRFKDTASRDIYVPHPGHQKLAQNLVRPIVEDVLVFDYEN
ncbi:Dabb family protein [Candidatus Poribacteria bacterium]|nr:Dabb family protein [Candidatus Poribacteria bacterium]